eukprot:COSAG01_NODE_27700_length_679_cov_0.886207_1_plen_64_part_10
MSGLLAHRLVGALVPFFCEHGVATCASAQVEPLRNHKKTKNIQALPPSSARRLLGVVVHHSLAR